MWCSLWLKILSCDFGFQGTRQLVGAGRPVATGYALEKRNDILDLAADGELGDADRVSGASADEATGCQNAVVHFVFN